MDFLTHGLTGAALARFFYGKVRPLVAIITLVIGATMPDYDSVVRFWSMTDFLEFHRGISHSLVGVTVAAIILASIMKAIFRDAGYLKLFVLALTGGLSHIFLDMINSYGTQLFMPFTRYRYAWDLVMIIDPFITVSLILALALSVIFKRRRVLFCGIAIALILTYVGLRAVCHAIAVGTVEKFALPGEKVVASGAYPEILTPFEWLYVIETDSHYYTGEVHILKGETRPNPAYTKLPEDEIVQVAKKAKTAEVFLRFAKYPYLNYHREGDRWVVTWRDLRYDYPFGSLRKRNRPAFLTTVVVSADRRILEESFHF